MTEVWMGTIGAGTEEDPYRPDVPEGTHWRCNDGSPVELNPLSPRYGHQINQHMLIEIVEAAEPIMEALDVSDEERLLVELCRCGRGGPMGANAEAAVATALRKYAALDKQAKARCLIHAVWRGLSSETAGEIAREQGLGDTTGPDK